MSSNIDFTTISNYNYSTNEQVIGTWVDGSKLYRKTIIYTRSITPSSQEINIPHNIFDIKHIWITGDSYMFSDQLSSRFYPLNYVMQTPTITNNSVTCAHVNKTNIVYNFAQYLVSVNTNINFYITLHYTKTSG